MANKHGLKGSIVKKQAASRKMAKHKKQTFAVDIGNENRETRYKTSYKKRIRWTWIFSKREKEEFFYKINGWFKGIGFLGTTTCKINFNFKYYDWFRRRRVS